MKFSVLIIFNLLFFAAFSQSFILNEDFQNGFPANWSRIDVDMQTPDNSVSEYNEAWIIKENKNDATDSVVSSTSFYSPIGTANKWLITPQLNLGAFGNFLNFEAASHDASFQEKYYVLLSTTDDQLSSFTDTLLHVPTESELWTSREIDLSALGFDDSTVYIAFVNRTYDGFKLYLDDIQVRIDDPLSIEEHINAKVRLYPNPSKDFINILGLGSNIEKYEIYDAIGNVILNGNDLSINVSELNSGFYQIRILDQNGNLILKKFVKE